MMCDSKYIFFLQIRLQIILCPSFHLLILMNHLFVTHKSCTCVLEWFSMFRCQKFKCIIWWPNRNRSWWYNNIIYTKQKNVNEISFICSNSFFNRCQHHITFNVKLTVFVFLKNDVYFQIPKIYRNTHIWFVEIQIHVKYQQMI